MNLSAAKARLSEVVREVCQTGQEVTITVDGEPTVGIAPEATAIRTLTKAEIATVRALTDAIGRIGRPQATFDAVAFIADGRR